MEPLLVSNTHEIRKPVSAPVAGAVWMMAAAALFAAMNGVVRVCADLGMHPFQIAFLRSIFALAFVLPFCLKAGIAELRTARWKLYLLRGGAAATAMLFWMTAIATMPMAEATAISFTAPLFATVGSALILKETVRARRWSAIIFGFAGVMIILRPGFQALEPGALAALAAACAMATAALCIKALTNTEPARRVVFYTSLILSVATFPFAFGVWTPMNLDFWGLGIALGFFGVTAHMCLTCSFKAADASLVMPFDYTRLPFVALVGWLAFGETVGWITWAGAVLIVGSALYVAYREQTLAVSPTKAEPPY